MPGGNEQMPPTPEPAPKREGPRVGGGLTQLMFESSGRRHGPPTLQVSAEATPLSFSAVRLAEAATTKHNTPLKKRGGGRNCKRVSFGLT